MASTLLLLVAIVIAARILSLRYSKGLNRYPGPFLASFTDLWKVWDAYDASDKINDCYVDVHEKYGEVVRIGPNNLSFAIPEAFHEIYGIHGSQVKAEMYRTTSIPQEGRELPNLLSPLDVALHDKERRIINQAYSFSGILKYEGWVDQMIAEFMRQMDRRVVGQPPPKNTVDLHEWVAFFAADVISNLTYGSPNGFMDTGTDIMGIRQGVRFVSIPWLYFSRMPLLDKITFKNPLLMWIQRRGFLCFPNPLENLAAPLYKKRFAYWKSQREKTGVAPKETVLDYLISQEDANSDKDDHYRGLAMRCAVGNIAAGSESTAMTITSILYFIAKDLKVYRKLRAEIDAVPAHALSTLETGEQVFSWTEARKLPYLYACILEGMRLNHVGRFCQDRETPPGGLTICGHFVPGGTDIGVHGSVLHRRRDVFGDDVNVFRPERWLITDEKKLQRMHNSMVTFSFGKYNCLGQHIARLEIYKFIPSILRRFDMRMVDQDSTWRLLPGAFTVPTDFYVRFDKV